MFISVTVKPRSHKNELIETAPHYFEARITAAPYEGKANEALLKLLASHFKVAKTRITISHGATSRKKMVEIRTG
jgi:uncharacterized protein (TIGR00251 family)